MNHDSEPHSAPDITTLLGWYADAGAEVLSEPRPDGSSQHTIADGVLRITLVRRMYGRKERAWFVAEGPEPKQTIVGNVENASELRKAIAWVKKHWGLDRK